MGDRPIIVQNDRDRVGMIRAEVEEVKGIMVDNIDKQFNNMENANNLERQTHELSFQSNAFRRTARRTKWQMIWQNSKINLIIGGICAIALIIIIVGIANAVSKN